jgi:hypothetical protein
MKKDLGFAIHKIFVGVFVLILSGCAGSQGLSPQTTSAIKTVGIVSALGDTLTLTRVASIPLAGGSTDKEASIAEWRIDAFVADAAKQLLGNQFDVNQVTYNPKTFVFHQSPDEFFPKDSLSEKEIVDALRSVSPQGLDAYIVITRLNARDDILRQVSGLEGIGIYEKNFITATNGIYVYAYYQVSVVEGRTFKIITRANGFVPDNSIGFEVRRLAYAPGDPMWENEEYDRLSASQKHDVESRMKDLISRSLQNTLRSLNLAR